MKITITSLCASLMLAGCAATPVSAPPGEKVAYEDRYVPTGTMFANKDPKRTDRTRVTNGEELENVIRAGGGLQNPSKM